MVCGYSGTQVATFLILLLGTTGIGVAFFTSYWEIRNSGLGFSYHDGLLYRCIQAKSGVLGQINDALNIPSQGCSFRYQSELDKAQNVIDADITDMHTRAGQIFDGTNVHTYEFITTVLIGFALFFGALAIIVAPCCCHRCGCCQSLLVLTSAFAAASGLVVYCIGRQKGWKVEVAGVTTVDFRETTHPFDGTYGWSFFVGVIGTIIQFMASSMFCMGRGRAHAYSEQL